MSLLNKSAVAAAFIGAAATAQAAISVLTVNFEITDNDGLSELAVGSTGEIQFLIDDATSPSFNDPSYDFLGAVTGIQGGSIDGLTLNPTIGSDDIFTYNDLDVGGESIDAFSLSYDPNVSTGNPTITLVDTDLTLAAPNSTWSSASTITGSVFDHYDDLVNSGSPHNGLTLDFAKIGSGVGQQNVTANITGGNISAIPEPSTFWLVGGAGLAALGIRRRLAM